MHGRFMESFARQLAAERQRIGKSQRGLAASAGVALDTVRLVEGGKREPRLATAVLLLRTLGRPAWKAIREMEEATYGGD